ncbi:hypothetical protein, partial [Morganella morganii]
VPIDDNTRAAIYSF